MGGEMANSYEVQIPNWLTPDELGRRFPKMHPVLQAFVGQLFDRDTMARFNEMQPDAAWQVDMRLMFDKGRGVLRPEI